MTTHHTAHRTSTERSWWIQRLRSSRLLQNVALLVAWLVVWEVGWLVEYTPHASVWFPVAGLTFAALLVMGATALPALLIGCVLITISTTHHYDLPLTDTETLRAGVLFGVAHILPYGIGSVVLRAVLRRGARDITRLVVSFLVVSAAAALLAAALVLPTLVASNMMAPAEVAHTWLPFWIGDMAGVMALAPLFVGLLHVVLPVELFGTGDWPSFPYRRPSRQFVYKLGLIACLLTASMVLAKITQQPNSAFAIFFLVIPHMWIACSESPLMNALAVAFTSFLIAFLVHVFQLMDFVMVYQFAISVVAANTLFALAIPTLIADNTRLRTVASTDALTQVASRDHLEQRAALEIARSGLKGHPVSLMLFDIDHFKAINDALGHQVGDRALQEVCRIARQVLRASDTLGRVGGDEFAALLPHTSVAAAEAIAARIVQQLGEMRIADGDHRVTASFGVAECEAHERYEHLFDRADQALYDAKLAGRNRVVAAEASTAAAIPAAGPPSAR